MKRLQASADSALLARKLRQVEVERPLGVRNVEDHQRDASVGNDLDEYDDRAARWVVDKEVGVQEVTDLVLAFAFAFLAARAATRCSSSLGSSLNE